MSRMLGKFAVTFAILLVACSDGTSITDPTDPVPSLGMANGRGGEAYTLLEGQLPAGERSVSKMIAPLLSEI